MKNLLAAMLISLLLTAGPAFAESEKVRFTPDCEFTVIFPGKISTKLNKGTAQSTSSWMHVRDIGHLDKHYEISAKCRPLDPRGREYELLMFYKNMEKEARRVRIPKPHTAVKQDRRHDIIIGEWRGYTRDYNKKPVTVDSRYLLGRHSKLLLLVATPGAHKAPSPLVTDFLKSARRK